MKKVSELTGAELDYWVAKANGDNPCIEDGKCMVIVSPGAMAGNETYRFYFQPSLDWRLGGPIIEREKISIVHDERDGTYQAGYGIELQSMWGVVFSLPSEYGPTPLIAAMRAFVLKRHGDEVPNE